MRRQLLRFTTAAGILLAASAATANAQGFGVMAGANFADISGDDIDGSDIDSRTGFAGGVFYEHKLGTSISLRPEVLYSFKGGTNTLAEDVTWQNDYIEVPVLLKYSFGSGATHPFVLIGPAISFNVNCNFTDGTDEASCDDVFGSDVASSTDFSGILGLGIQWNALDINVRYDLGFTNVLEDVDATNKTISILLGYNFTMPR
jgi:outer membrane protein with beta-barrel domain